MNVTFIIGAGASYNFGFPTGLELIDDVESLLSPVNFDLGRFSSKSNFLNNIPDLNKNQDRFYKNAAAANLLIDNSVRIEHINEFRIALGKSGAMSIDLFLRENPRFGKLGKLCIATIISAYETLFLSSHNSRKTHDSSRVKFDGDWVRLIWNQHLRHQGFSNQRVRSTFLIFNYDRCIQFLLANMAIYSKSSLSPDQAIKYVNENFKFIHIYGSLGDILQPDLNLKDFGDTNPNPKKMDIRSKSIRVMEEDRNNNGGSGIEMHLHQSAVKEAILECDHLIFLGFGFDLTNLSELQLSDGIFQDRKDFITGTCYGLRSGEILSISKTFEKYYVQNGPIVPDRPIKLINQDCSSFLREIFLP